MARPATTAGNTLEPEDGNWLPLVAAVVAAADVGETAAVVAEPAAVVVEAATVVAGRCATTSKFTEAVQPGGVARAESAARPDRAPVRAGKPDPADRRRRLASSLGAQPGDQ